MDWKNEKQLQYVLSHEYVHIYRYDTVTKLIATLALCIHWFNPFVWVMYILFNRDIELACDESVIRQFGEKSKSAYSLMLPCQSVVRRNIPARLPMGTGAFSAYPARLLWPLGNMRIPSARCLAVRARSEI